MTTPQLCEPAPRMQLHASTLRLLVALLTAALASVGFTWLLTSLGPVPRMTWLLPFLAGLILAVLVGTFRTGLEQAGRWFVLLLGGTTSSLWLIDAGPFVRYQHYRSWDRLLTAESLPFLGFLLLQAILVFLGGRSLWPLLWSWTRSHLRAWQLVGLASIFLLTSATLSRDPAVYLGELAFACFLQVVSLANLVLVVAAIPETMLSRLGIVFDRLLGCSDSVPTSPLRLDRFTLVCALWATALSAFLSFAVYQRHPHIPDEVVYLLHARYFASGMLMMPLPPVVAGFDIDLMSYDDQSWYCPVPPGWPAALALGVLLGVPWLVNPVLTGLNILLTSLFLQRLYDRPTTRVAVLLLTFSPWNLFLGMSLMTHTFTLTCALGAALALARLRETGGLHWGLLAGAATGAVSLIRPLEGLCLAALLGVWVLFPSPAGRRGRSLASLILGTILVGGLVLPYNAVLTGSPTLMPIQVYTDKMYGPGSNALGFGPNRGLGWSGLDPRPGHDLLDVFINANLNLFALNIELFGWPTGSLLLVALGILARKPNRADGKMLAVLGLIIGIHSLYYFSGGPDFGARYWYLILLPCVALASRGIQFLLQQTQPQTATRLLAGLACLMVISLVTFYPWRALDKYWHYRGMRPDIRQLAHQHHFGRSLVLIRGNRHPDYASAAIYNPLDLHAAVPLYAWDRDPQTRAALLRAYPDRPVWLVHGPSLTGAGFEVVQGPLSPEERTRLAE